VTTANVAPRPLPHATQSLGAVPQPEVVIVSPYFPPSTLAGVHRARHLARHLPAAGWKPIIICVNESCHEQRLDPGLAKLVPPHVEVIKVGAIAASLARPLGLGDISLRGWSQLRRITLDTIATRSVKAVLITGSPYFPMILAPLIRRRFNVPVVLDFQDPWVSKWGARQPLRSKAGLMHRIARVLEPRALRAAAHITSVSARQNEELAARYPWLNPAAMTDIPIGADPEDFVALRAASPPPSARRLDDGRFTLAYVGTVWPLALPTLRTLLRATAIIRDSSPALYSRLRLLFVGTTGTPSDTTIYLVRPLAEAEGVGDVVEEIPQRLPYLEALAITARAGANLILGSDEPHYTASKVYGLLMAGRPFVSLLHEQSSAHAVAIAAGGGVALSFASRAELPELEQPLADAIIRIAANPHGVGHVDPAAYAPFEAPVIAARYGRIFDSLSTGRR
jgi:glycosyltransferase involved in cell wall biosynthesis